MGEMSFNVFVDGGNDDIGGLVDELCHRIFFLEEGNDRGVLTGVGFVLFIAAGIGERSAVEDESAAIAREIGRESLLITKTENLYSERTGCWSDGLRC